MIETLREKMYRAIRMNRSFTVFDIAQLSGATTDYAKKYIASLVGQGLLKKIGIKNRRAIYGPAATLPAECPWWHTKERNYGPQKGALIRWARLLLRMLQHENYGKAAVAHQVVGEKLQLVLEKK
jgi:hypothetical protein